MGSQALLIYKDSELMYFIGMNRLYAAATTAGVDYHLLPCLCNFKSAHIQYIKVYYISIKSADNKMA